MVYDTNWLLPEGVEEILPDRARELELLRRKLIDLLDDKGFSLVIPPLIEYVDSLLTGTGYDLDTQTYKFMDQHTQRMLGIRADITPQIARIDAHQLRDNEINRLCYAGSVLRTRPAQMGGARELLQIGAEIFGDESEAADIEIVCAMLECVAASTNKAITLSLGHVGIYRALKNLAGLSASDEGAVFDSLLRKSYPDIQQLNADLDTNLTPFETLLGLQGSGSVLAATEAAFSQLEGVIEAVQQTSEVYDEVAKCFPNINIHVDFADVDGYRYHTGLKFAAFVEDEGRSLARGGRYDRIGEHFGRARAATGFSADLKSLFAHSL